MVKIHIYSNRCLDRFSHPASATLAHTTEDSTQNMETPPPGSDLNHSNEGITIAVLV